MVFQIATNYLKFYWQKFTLSASIRNQNFEADKWQLNSAHVSMKNYALGLFLLRVLIIFFPLM